MKMLEFKFGAEHAKLMDSHVFIWFGDDEIYEIKEAKDLDAALGKYAEPAFICIGFSVFSVFPIRIAGPAVDYYQTLTVEEQLAFIRNAANNKGKWWVP